MVVRRSEQFRNFEKRRSRGFGPFWVRVGVGAWLRVSGRVGLGLRPYLDPTRKCFLPRKREQPTAPKIRATKTIGTLSAGYALLQIRRTWYNY